eukprot:403370813
MSQINQVPLQRYQNTVCLITGGTTGIGLGIVKRVLQEGGSVVIATIENNLNEILNQQRQTFPQSKIEGIHCDIASKQDRLNLTNLISQKFGKLDIIFANAAVIQYKRNQLELKEDQFQKMFDVNVKANFFLIKECLDLMKKSDRGDANILLTSSMVSKTPDRYGGVYAMTKAALNNMAIWLSQELSEFNIRVNTICPGAFKTQMTVKQQDAFGSLSSKAFGEPEQLASVACMMASKDGSFINGESYVVDNKVFSKFKL